MSNTPITPEQIKSIAAEIRRTEIHHLGTKLPNTSALNAITRALGLGTDFRAFKAAHDAGRAQAETATTSAVKMSKLIFVIQNEEIDMQLCDSEIEAEILAIIHDAGFQGDITEGAHDHSLVLAGSMGDKHTEADLVALKRKLQAKLDTLVSAMEIGPILGAIHWQETQSDRELTVNFRYHDNDQVVSAGVNEAAWQARHMLGHNDEFAVLVLGKDIEVEASYTADDISVEDVLIDVTFWNGE